MAKKKNNKSKTRTQFRKNYDGRTRDGDLTRDYREGNVETDDAAQSERVSGKGKLTRSRTITGASTDTEETGLGVQLDIDETAGQRGVVLSVHGLNSKVRTDDGVIYNCTVRGLLKSLSTDQRHVVASGDRVFVRTMSDQEGVIERIEPRTGTVCRTSRGKQHVLVANVDQVLIVTCAAQPTIKPNLIDRFLVTAEKSGIAPIICINKVDLIDLADLQPLAGVYGQMGYEVLFLSATTGYGVEHLQAKVTGKQSVVAGQSGVGKSSLLNAIQPELGLKVREVSLENDKGRHTTTAATLIPLQAGGYIVDTPGIRQFQLWDVIPTEVAGFFRDIRPFINRCKFPDCSHTHEMDCGVKNGVADGLIDLRRYESYCAMHAGDDL